MCANADADVEIAGEREFDGCAGGLKFTVFTGNECVDEVAVFFNADGLRRGYVGLDFMRVGAGGVAELQRGEAASVHGDIDGA